MYSYIFNLFYVFIYLKNIVAFTEKIKKILKKISLKIYRKEQVNKLVNRSSIISSKAT